MTLTLSVYLIAYQIFSADLQFTAYNLQLKVKDYDLSLFSVFLLFPSLSFKKYKI